MQTIDSTIAAVDRAWRAYGIDAADRAALAADLRLDLRAAADDGIEPDRLLGPDVAGFARRLADEAGLRRVPRQSDRLIAVALGGAAAGAAVGYLLMELAYPLLARTIDFSWAGRVPVQVAVVGFYGVPAAVLVAGAIIAVRFGLRDLPRIRRTAVAMMVLLPVAGMLVTPLTMAFAWSTGYSAAAPVLAAEIAMVLAAISGATLLARRWALRDRDPGTAKVPADATPS